MAQLSPVRFRALDASGALVSGAGLFVYEVGTSTLASLYSDADLLVATANPVISSATGYWAQFYTASGETFDIQARATSSAASTLLWEALEVDSVGSEDTGTFFRDYAGNGRVQIVGATGVPRMEFGPPTGDNIGGGLIISGWAGTDLESADWLGPLDITGNLSVTGSIQSDKYLDSGEETASASVIIDIPTGYDAYDLEITNLITSASTSIEVFFGFDGATFKTGADDYAWSYTGLAPTATSSSDISDARLAIGTTGAAVTAGNPSRILITIDSIAGKETGISGSFRLANSDGAYATSLLSFVGQTRGKNYGKISQIKLSGNTANIGFRWVLKGKKGVV